jgi:hypothetical protein
MIVGKMGRERGNSEVDGLDYIVIRMVWLAVVHHTCDGHMYLPGGHPGTVLILGVQLAPSQHGVGPNH